MSLMILISPYVNSMTLPSTKNIKINQQVDIFFSHRHILRLVLQKRYRSQLNSELFALIILFSVRLLTRLAQVQHLYRPYYRV